MMEARSAARQRARRAALELRGRPPPLQGVFRPARPLPSPCPLESDLPAPAPGQPPLIVQSAPAGAQGLAWVWLTVPESTPPGTYRGVLGAKGSEHPVVIDVEPVVRARLLPEQADVEVSPGAELIIDVQLVNLGNAPIEIPATSAIELEDSEAFSRAIRRAATADLDKGERPLEVAAEEFAASRGGVGRLRVRAGAGKVKPGELRRLRAAMRVPEGLRPGRLYLGSWNLADTSFTIRINADSGRHKEDRE